MRISDRDLGQKGKYLTKKFYYCLKETGSAKLLIILRAANLKLEKNCFIINCICRFTQLNLFLLKYRTLQKKIRKMTQLSFQPPKKNQEVRQEGTSWNTVPTLKPGGIR